MNDIRVLLITALVMLAISLDLILIFLHNLF
ncbi:hypothetical protein B0G77_3920 [Paraburkholderia sp. BL10I2N1]|nr:hypothetical protein B0G77_3920 [Paraburkholderia sp. BL10I2N1]